MADRAPFGLLAEFRTAEDLEAAVHAALDNGHQRLDAFTPFPVEGVNEALGLTENRIGWFSLGGGILGIALMLAIQIGSNFNYPINVGGRPILAWPAFAVVDFELMVLFSVIVPVLAMLILDRLPKLHHPIFNAPRFALASDDRFFLLIKGDDPRFTEAGLFLDTRNPVSIERVE